MGGGISKHHHTQSSHDSLNNSQEASANKIKEKYEEYRDHQFVILVHETAAQLSDVNDKMKEFEDLEDKKDDEK